MYEATGGDARRVMHFLHHRSLDETQKYIDRLVAQTEREDASIMATFERGSAVAGTAAPSPPTHRATAGATVIPIRAPSV